MRYYRFILVLSLSSLFTSCFTSVDPIFDDNQIVNDPRILGHFINQAQDGHPLNSTWWIRRSEDFQKHYEVWVKDGPATIELLGTLFRLDKSLYLDLYPFQDSGQLHKPSEPETESEMLHSTVYERRHLIWKVEVNDSSITYFVPTRNGVGRAIGLLPEPRSVRAAGELEIILLPRSKKEAQEFLKKCDGNPKIYDWKGKLIKKPEA